MKKLSIFLLVIGVALLSIGAVNSFSSSGVKEPNKEVKKELISLGVIDDYVKKSHVFLMYSNHFVIDTKVEKNKYVIEYNPKEGSAIPDSGTLTLNLKDDVLETELFIDNTLYIKQNFVKEVLRAVCLARGIDSGLIDRSFSLIDYGKADLNKNGYLFNMGDETKIFKVSLSKDIVLPDVKNVYFTKEDFEMSKYMLGDKKAAGQMEKGNVTLFYSNPKNTYYIYEYKKNGSNTYNTIINLVEFYMGAEEAENLKKSMPVLKSGTYNKVVVDTEYVLQSGEIVFFEEDGEKYNNDYSFVKIVLK